MRWGRKSPRSKQGEPAKRTRWFRAEEAGPNQGGHLNDRARALVARRVRDCSGHPKKTTYVLVLYACLHAHICAPGHPRTLDGDERASPLSSLLAFGTFYRSRYLGDGWRFNYSGHEPKLSESCQEKYVLILCSLDQDSVPSLGQFNWMQK